MTVALVNRFTAPGGGPTAAALTRLADLLIARLPGTDLRVIGTGRFYAGAGAKDESSFLRRIAASWRDGGRLAAAAAGHGVVVSLTDPPFLAFRLARRLGVETVWIEWTMDLYPQALAAALGLSSRRALLPAGRRRLRSRRPDLRLCLGAGQAAFLAAGELAPVPHLILPAGVCEAPQRPLAPPSSPQEPVRLVYAGNLGRAHWADALPLLARFCDPARFRLTVAAYGQRAAAARRATEGFSHVEWRDGPLTEAELNAAHAHIVSLKENWTHVSVPSKAVSALCRGRPVLFFGSAQSDAWGWAEGAGLLIEPRLQAAAAALPYAMARLAEPSQLAALTERAVKAGERLRRAEALAADELAVRLADGLSLPINTAAQMK